MLTCVELFAGAGGLALGLQRAGFRHVALVERDAQAAATLRANFDPAAVVEADARDVDWASFEGVDLLAGGPPCQPFSAIGANLGETDDRNGFPAYAAALTGVAPRAFLVENVPGLLSPRHRAYLHHILAELREPRPGLQYRVGLDVVNAADHGVAQKRKRLLIVGYREEIPANCWTAPEPTHSLDALLHSQHVAADYWRRHPVPESERVGANTVLARRLAHVREHGPGPLKPWATFREATADLGEPGPLERSRPLAHTLFCTPRPSRYWRTHATKPDQPANTILAKFSSAGGRTNNLALPNGIVRKFTVPEIRRLQGFPDDHRLEARSLTRAFLQVGNAVPPPLAEAVGKTVAEQLRGAETGTKLAAAA